MTDPAILHRHTVPDDETLVEIPPGLLEHLAVDGVAGTVTNLIPPIVEVTDDGNFIVQGTRVTDEETLGQMRIPDHETCVHVTKPAVLALLAEA